MSNANRLKCGGMYLILMLLSFSFWGALVSAIWGSIEVSVLFSIGYAFSGAFMLYSIFGKSKEITRLKKIVMFVVTEAAQLIPYMLILVIRKLM